MATVWIRRAPRADRQVLGTNGKPGEKSWVGPAVPHGLRDTISSPGGVYVGGSRVDGGPQPIANARRPERRDDGGGGVGLGDGEWLWSTMGIS